MAQMLYSETQQTPKRHDAKPPAPLWQTTPRATSAMRHGHCGIQATSRLCLQTLNSIAAAHECK